MHTFKGWLARDPYRIKAGEHGIETRLWKKKNKKKDEKQEKEESKTNFYLAKAYLFSSDQVELQEEIQCAI